MIWVDENANCIISFILREVCPIISIDIVDTGDGFNNLRVMILVVRLESDLVELRIIVA